MPYNAPVTQVKFTIKINHAASASMRMGIFPNTEFPQKVISTGSPDREDMAGTEDKMAMARTKKNAVDDFIRDGTKGIVKQDIPAATKIHQATISRLINLTIYGQSYLIFSDLQFSDITPVKSFYDKKSYLFQIL